MKKIKLNRLISGALAAVIACSSFLGAGSAYAQETASASVGEVRKVTFHVNDYGCMDVTDSTGNTQTIEPGETVTLEMEDGSVLKTEAKPQENCELTGYTVFNADGELESETDKAALNKESAYYREVTVLEDIQIDAAFAPMEDTGDPKEEKASVPEDGEMETGDASESEYDTDIEKEDSETIGTDDQPGQDAELEDPDIEVAVTEDADWSVYEEDFSQGEEYYRVIPSMTRSVATTNITILADGEVNVPTAMGIKPALKYVNEDGNSKDMVDENGNKKWRMAYCLAYQKEHPSSGLTWNGSNTLNQGIIYCLAYGVQYWGETCAYPGYSTGDWRLDYWVTQMAIHVMNKEFTLAQILNGVTNQAVVAKLTAMVNGANNANNYEDFTGSKYKGYSYSVAPSAQTEWVATTKDGAAGYATKNWYKQDYRDAYGSAKYYLDNVRATVTGAQGAEVIWENSKNWSSFKIWVPSETYNNLQRTGATITATVTGRLPSYMSGWFYTPADTTKQNITIFEGAEYQNFSHPVTATVQPVNGKVSVKKVSANPDLTDGNSCYSLADAEFGVYSDNDCTKLVTTLKTDASGNTSEAEVAAGTYWIKETKAPKGFALDPNPKKVTVTTNNVSVVAFTDAPQGDPVNIVLGKVDKETNDNKPEGSASFVDAEFTVKYYEGFYDANNLPANATCTWIIKTDQSGRSMLSDTFKVSGDEFYRNTKGRVILPLGTITIQETKAPEGYLLNDEIFVRQITSEGTSETVETYNEPTVKEPVIKGGVLITKWDYDTQTNVSQGAASVEGAEFTITNQSENPVVVNGESYEKGDTIMVIVTDKNGVASTDSNALPYGDYQISETKAPTGYLLNGEELTQDFSIRENGKIVQLNTEDTAARDKVIRGGVSIEKWDYETKENAAQGGATIEGAEFTITNQSENPVVVNGESYEKGDTIMVLVTDKNGVASTDSNALPYGDYRISETKAPIGYLLNGEELTQDFSIRENGKIVQLNAKDTAAKDKVIRGGVCIEKWDYETKENAAQGGATIEGAEFTITNLSENPVVVNGESYGKGTAVMVIVTDENGMASTEEDALPYGDYQIAETKAPTGYLPTGSNLTQKFSIRENDKIVQLNTKDTAAQNQVKRGDLKLIKAAAESYERMANVKFTITSQTTGESHAFVTDENGYYSTESDWNLHTRNTNRGETSEDGIWFGTSAPDDEKGALIYDTYTIEEQPCDANKGYKLIKFDVVISRNNVTIDLGTVTDELIPVVAIQTTATVKDTGNQTAHAVKDLTVTDRVSYVNLTPGEEYTVKGTLMDKETGKAILADGKEITVEKTFTPKEANGGVDMEFIFDATGFDGKDLVVFEKLFLDKQEIAAHEDLDDEDQTIHILQPEIKTNAADQATGTHTGHASEKVTVVDKVTYTDLIPNHTYQVKGTLMDKETGKALLVNGKEVTAEKEFTAVTSKGSVELAFTFDASALKGKEIVAFEKLLYEEKEIAVHEDLKDKTQTVEFTEPEIRTEASDQSTGTHEGYALQSVTIADQVTYSGLIKGQEYTEKGTLMDKETQKPLLADGKEITAEKTFVAENTAASVKLTFTFDASALKGKEIVAFEKLFYNGKEIAVHEDLTDPSQTVKFTEPEIATNASDRATGTKEGTVSEKLTIVDQVTYKNLIPGKEYTVKGTLMDKKTGKALLVNGKEITAEKTFTADKTAGSVELEFIFDATGLAGQEIVVFEKLLFLGQEIATHEDINDKNQTVSLKTPKGDTVTISSNKPGTTTISTSSPVKTGDTTNITLYIALTAVAALLAAISIIRRKRQHTVKRISQKEE